MYVLSRLRSVAKLGNRPMHFRRFRQNFIIQTVLGSTHLGQVKQTHSNKQRARLTTQRTRAELNGTTTRCQTIFLVLQRHLPACYGTLYFDLHYQLWNEIWNEMYWVFECIDDRFNSCRRFTLPWLSIFDWFLLFIRLTWLSMFSNKQAVLVTVED